mgnify:CR=1 FL=1
MKTPEEILEDSGYSIEDLEEAETILFRDPDYSTAICGVSDDYRVIYDYDKMLEYLMTYEEMDEAEAADWLSYNTIRSLNYISGNKPIIMYPIMD